MESDNDRLNGETYFDSLESATDQSENGIFKYSYNEATINVVPPSKLKFSEENKKYLKKALEIETLLAEKEVNIVKLIHYAKTDGGLVNDHIRKTAWPLLLGLKDIKTKVPCIPSENELQHHPEYDQIVLDVNRSLKRFPPGIPLEQRLSLQKQLTFLILKVVTVHPRLRYYQGYHDIAITLLLVAGEETAFHLLEKISINHLKDCMEPTMDKTAHLLNYIFPLVKHQNGKVYEHLEKSGVGVIFALPWFLTWFGHSLNNYSDVVRLYDYFLASEHLAPLYLSAVIVVFRSKEILSTACDMANIYSLLSQIPDSLPFEQLLKNTTELYEKFPPDKIQSEAEERTRKEALQRKNEKALRQRRLNQNLPLIWRLLGHVDPDRRWPFWGLRQAHYIPMHLPRYRYLVATATFAVGLYAVYMKTVNASDADFFR